MPFLEYYSAFEEGKAEFLGSTWLIICIIRENLKTFHSKVIM
jgi:hypothetical protein